MGYIVLEIPEDFSYIAGRDYGYDMCEKQIIPNIMGGKVEVKLPDHIEGVAVGFTQGVKERVYLNNKEVKVKFSSSNKRLEEKVNTDYDM